METPGAAFPGSVFRTQVIGEKGMLDFDGYTHLDLSTSDARTTARETIDHPPAGSRLPAAGTAVWKSGELPPAGVPPLAGARPSPFEVAEGGLSPKRPKGIVARTAIPASRDAGTLCNTGGIALAGGWERVMVQEPFNALDPADPVRLRSFSAQNQEFVDAIRERREPNVTAADGRAAVELAQAAMLSAGTGRLIELPLT